jgi:AMP deaminase
LRPRTCPGPDITRLCCGYLLCDSISGGLNLADNTFLQLLYFLKQVGIVMSPLYDNSYYPALRKDYPFNKFFLRGLRVFVIFNFFSLIF